jgi:hypothetical protein
MSAFANLRRHRELGTELLGDFINATPETAAELVEREGAWMRDLVLLAAPLGDAAARLEPLTLMRPHEYEVVMRCMPLDFPNFDNVRRCHATRLYRLDELFTKIPMVLPKDKGGRRPIDPPERIKAVQEALDEQKRQRRKPNKEGAIKKVLNTLDFGEGPNGDTYDKAFERLKKRKFN